MGKEGEEFKKTLEDNEKLNSRLKRSEERLRTGNLPGRVYPKKTEPEQEDSGYQPGE